MESLKQGVDLDSPLAQLYFSVELHIIFAMPLSELSKRRSHPPFEPDPLASIRPNYMDGNGPAQLQ